MEATASPWRGGRSAVTYHDFLVYLFDAQQTRELAVELAVAVDERQYFEQLSALLV
jgi:hypothetical protein